MASSLGDHKAVGKFLIFSFPVHMEVPIAYHDGFSLWLKLV